MFSVFVRGTLIQLNTPDHMRGRVSAASGLAISASNELGEMPAGAMAAALGPVGAVVIGGAGAIGVTALWAWLFPDLRRVRPFGPAVRYNKKVGPTICTNPGSVRPKPISNIIRSFNYFFTL